MSKEGLLKIEGRVTEVMPNTQFMVEIEYQGQKKTIRCILNGRMRMNKIKVMLADKVDVELPKPQNIDDAIGRIIFRKK